MKVFFYMMASLAVAAVLAGCATAGVGPGQPLDMGPLAERTPRGEAMGHYITSVFLERTGQMEAALEELRRVPELDKTAYTPALRLIRTYVQTQDFDKARDLAENLAKQAPENPAVWFMLGEIEHQLKHFDAAVGAFNKAIQLNPENAHNYGALAEVLEASNDLVSAFDSYETLAKLNPNSAALQFQLGSTLVRMNDKEQARQRFVRAIELNSNFTQAHYMLGILCLEMDRPEESIKELTAFLEQRPADARATESIVGALARLKRFDEAIARLQLVLAGEAVLPKNQVLASVLLLHAGKPVEAEKAVPPTGLPIHATIVRALARKAQGLPVEAIVASLDAIEGDYEAEISECLNDLVYLLGDEVGAGWLLAQIEGLQAGLPPSRILNLTRSRLLYTLERQEEALTLLESMYTEGTQDKTLLFYLADAAEKLKRSEAAEKYVKAYLVLEPDSPEMLNFLGYMYADHNMKLDEAKHLIEKALAIDSDNPFYLDSLGWVYYRLGDGAKAVEYIRRAILGMSSDDAILREHLGDAYLLNKEPAKAAGEWRRALRLDPKLKGVQEKLDQVGVK